jgi:hypothetical protein
MINRVGRPVQAWAADFATRTNPVPSGAADVVVWLVVPSYTGHQQLPVSVVGQKVKSKHSAQPGRTGCERPTFWRLQKPAAGVR